MQGIEFQIINDSDEAAKGLERLERALSNLKINVKEGASSLSQIGNGISKLRQSLKDIDPTGIGDKLKSLSTAVNNLKIDRSATISSSLPKNITALNEAALAADPAKITSIGTSLQTIADVGNSAKISAALPKNLEDLSVALSYIDPSAASILRDIGDGLKPLSELGTAHLTSYINQLGKFPKLIEDLGKLDIAKFSDEMRDLADAMKPFADEMAKVSSGFSAFPSRIQRLITSTEQYNGTVKRATRNTNSFGSALKKVSLAVVIKDVGLFIGKAMEKASQYQEVLNLFTVSMGEYAKEAYEYAQTVSDAMGIDPAEWMENQGVFNTIITGFGVAGDKAAYMSKNLTQLSYDLASFYNIGFTEAMQKVQSGIAGELEPMRRLGYDLSVARLEQERLNLGIEKSVSDMTQAEKSQLRYYAMMTQVTQVQGDMARTLNQPANMLRILRAELEQTARAFGNIFIPILTNVLPWLIAVAQGIREIVVELARLFNIEIGEVDWGSSFSTAAGATGEIEDNMSGAAGAAKDLKRYLAGFDELNVLPDKTSGGSGGGVSAGGGGLDIPLLGYDFLDDEINKKVSAIKEKLEPVISFVKDNMEEILELATTIGIAVLAWKLSNEFLTGISMLKTLAKNGLSIPLTIVAGVILSATGFKIEFSGIEDAIEKKLNSFNFGEIVLGGLTGTAGAGLLGKGIGQFIAKAFGTSSVAKAITAGGGAISTGIIGAAIGGIVAGIPMFITGIYDAIVNGLNILNGLLIPAGATMAGAGIGAIIGSLGGPIGTGIGALIGLVVGALTDLGILIYEKWDEICAFFAPVAEWFNVNVVQPISGFFSELWSGIVKTFSPAVTWFSDLWKSVSQTFKDVFYDIGVIANGTWETIKIVWGIASGWVDTKIIKPISGLFSSLWSGIKKWASDAWDKIRNGFLTAYNYIDTRFLKPLRSAVSTVFDGMVGAVKAALNGVISALNSALRWMFGGINSILSSLKNISVAGYSPFAGLKTINVPQIPMLAEGGFPDPGQFFFARENGVPEMVGSIGRRTAVANNDQIVEAVKAGVYEAVVAATGGGNNQNGGQAQVVSANVNGKNLFEFVVDYARGETVRTGANPLLEF